MTRTVTARQAVGAILSVSVSFQVDEEAPEVQTAELPEAPPPSELHQDSWSSMFERASVPTPDPLIEEREHVEADSGLVAVVSSGGYG